MPPHRTPPHSPSRSLSPYTPPPPLHEENPRPFIDVYQFAELVNDPDSYNAIQIELFERYDLTVKTMMFKHVYQTIGQLRKEIRRQWAVATELFDGMAHGGLHEQLGDLGRHDGIEQEEIVILEPEEVDPLPPYRRTPSPDVPLINPDTRRPTSPLPPVEVWIAEIQAVMTQDEDPIPSGSRENPIVVDDGDDGGEYLTPSTDVYCFQCHKTGHSYYDCTLYECDHCHAYAPGHPVSDCFYARYN